MDIIAKPFGYLLKFCYDITSSYALALLIFTFLFKLILLPLSIKQQKASQSQARIRPKEMAIRKRYVGRTDPNARVELSNDLMKLYQEERVSAAGGCLPMLIQIPIIYVLYQIITKPLQYICMASVTAIGDLKTKIFELFSSGALNAANSSEKILKRFTDAGGNLSKFGISEIEMLSVMEKNSSEFSAILEGHGLSAMTYPDFTVFGGAINLADIPTFTSIIILIPLFAALFQLASSFVLKIFGPKIDMSAPGAEQTQKTMLYMNVIFPLMTFFMAFSFPAILGLYWIYQSIFGALTQIALYKLYPIPVFTPEEIAAVEYEMNKDYVKPDVKYNTRSLHSIDDGDSEIEYVDKTDNNNEESVGNKVNTVSSSSYPLPPRRRYDKNGNKIRSLHFIDEDDEEETPLAEKDENEPLETEQRSDMPETENNVEITENEASASKPENNAEITENEASVSETENQTDSDAE